METEHLTTTEVETLKTAFASEPYTGKTAKAIVNLLLSREMIDNPEPRDQVPKPLTVEDVMVSVPDAEYKNLDQGFKSTVRDDIQNQDRRAVGSWAKDQLRIENISQATHDAIIDLVTDEIPDPDYDDKIPGKTRIESLIGRWVDALKQEEIEKIMEAI